MASNVQSLAGRNVVVAGGTGNVGSFIVGSLLAAGAQVAVPSRSEEKLAALRGHVESRAEGGGMDRLSTHQGNIGDPVWGRELLRELASRHGRIDGAVASLGRFQDAPSLLKADPQKLRQVLDDYLLAHFDAARLFLPALLENGGGHYLLINGPLAVTPWKGAGLVSIATAAQQMLFKSLCLELEGKDIAIFELMHRAFVRDHATVPGSGLPAEAVGDYAAYLMGDAARHLSGSTLELASLEPLYAAGLGPGAAAATP
ncbi:SDR family NAD(P)-dependent oxidoreductase [Devosia nitrariae]|uniref:NAD(P)-dependent dehydrogenase (Short-subunit alcohol dehydrogenase family) n=1 Tax=Devosia nitrariae TaxID=2071872 RepID=A0ABQ5W1N7_9HYPH|nr:SDR family NAD(P)-dependent oxidoreductase [Devosia nitrariae]GLQ54002.1 hypothetical protein GCM10010862_12610 [Devosia nitrariae]